MKVGREREQLLWWGQVLVSGMLLLLAGEVFGRIIYPHDLYFASESPFMTNLLKIDAGVPLFTSVEQMNSHIYAPGLEYLYFILAKPFGILHDVRFVRLLIVLLGVGAAAVGTWVVEMAAGQRVPRLLTGGVLVLVLFKNFSADMVHPDNFHMLHTVLSLAFTLLAAKRNTLTWAIVAVVWAGLGVLTKQTAALTVVGVLVAIIWQSEFSRSQIVLLIMLGISTLGCAVMGLWWGDFGRFYTYELSLMHDILPAKLLDLPRVLLAMPHKIVLLLLLPPAIRTLWRNKSQRDFLISWVAIGIFGTGGSLIAYIKAFGAWNNLGIFDVWVTLLMFVALQVNRENAKVRKENLFAQGATTVPIRRRVRFAVVIFALLTLFPVRVPPPPAYYQYGAEIEQQIGRDLAAGKQIMLANGTTFLTRNGAFDVPFDRAAAATDLKGADLTPRATHQRITDHAYDRIYLNVPSWYADETLTLLATHYELVDQIDAPTPAFRYLFGYQKELFEPVLVLEPRE